MARGFAEALNLTLGQSTLTPGEIATMHKLVEEKYGATGWNHRL
jgi:hypothetical protein